MYWFPNHKMEIVVLNIVLIFSNNKYLQVVLLYEDPILNNNYYNKYNNYNKINLEILKECLNFNKVPSYQISNKSIPEIAIQILINYH